MTRHRLLSAAVALFAAGLSLSARALPRALAREKIENLSSRAFSLFPAMLRHAPTQANQNSRAFSSKWAAIDPLIYAKASGIARGAERSRQGGHAANEYATLSAVTSNGNLRATMRLLGGKPTRTVIVQIGRDGNPTGNVYNDPLSKKLTGR